MNMIQWLKNIFKQDSQAEKAKQPSNRRDWMMKIAAGSGAAALGIQQANAHKLATEEDEEKEERFPGDPPEHFLAFPLNHPEAEYHDHVLGSVGAMIAKYEDNVDQVVVCFGAGIHVLAKKPQRPVSDSVKAKVKSLADQGVKFHACNRTMTSMKWGKEDLYAFAEVVDVGAADIMELQEKNYALMVW